MSLSSTNYRSPRVPAIGISECVQSASENKAAPRSETYDKPRGLYSVSPAGHGRLAR
jgi:hypothetical protein